MNWQNLTRGQKTTIIISVIGVIGSIVTAYITYLGVTAPVKLSIMATQTAEMKSEGLLSSTPKTTSQQTPVLTETLIPIPAETNPPALASAATPAPIVVADTSNLVGWFINFNESKENNALNKIIPVDDAIEMSYAVGKDGFVIITKGIKSRALSGTEGIEFSYMGRGAANSIEFKLLLRYTGDDDDTTYGILWNRATDTGGLWLNMDVFYSDMKCWWPEANCKLHGDLLDITMVDRFDFVVSNKPGDEAGSGWVRFKEVFGIIP